MIRSPTHRPSSQVMFPLKDNSKVYGVTSRRLALLGTLLITLYLIAIWRPWLPNTIQYSLVGDDYPATWEGLIGPLDDDAVILNFQNSIRYELDTAAGDADFASLLPSGGHTIQLGPDGTPFTLAMFHQLKCLSIIRDGYIALSRRGVPQTELGRHCVDYLWQSAICRGSDVLENMMTDRLAITSTDWDQDHVCRDWQAVYAGAEENWRQWS